MAWIIEKRGRFLAGHSYSTLNGLSFRWTADKEAALRLHDDHPMVITWAQQTGGKAEHVPNTYQELRALGRLRMQKDRA